MWVAQDRLAEHTARAAWLDVGTRQGTAEQARVQFTWRETVSSTPNARFRRVEIQVFPSGSPEHAAATLIGYSARRD
jgi:general secretion pathway protein I